MRNLSLASVALFVVAAAVSVPKSAWALGPVDLEVAVKGGVGSLGEPSGTPDPLGFGIGGRAGVDLFTSYYAGVIGMYNVGNSNNEAGGGTFSAHSAQYGVELGYNIYLLQLIGVSPDIVGKLLDLRPQVGVGNITLTAEAKGFPGMGDVSQSQSDLYLEPGLTGLVALGPLLLGLDVNALWIPSLSGTSNTGVTAHLQLGIKL